MTRRRIYLASSWRNPLQPRLVSELRTMGHEVYDFRNPAPGDEGFAWSEVDPKWRTWQVDDFARALESEPARRGFESDKRGLDWATVGMLLLPAGKSSHLELGYLMGRGVPCCILCFEPSTEPELMYKLADEASTGEGDLKVGPIVTTLSGVRHWLVNAPFWLPDDY